MHSRSLQSRCRCCCHGNDRMIITRWVIAACLSLETNLLVQLVGAPSCFGHPVFPVFSGSGTKQVRCLSRGGNCWRGQVSRGVSRRLLTGDMSTAAAFCVRQKAHWGVTPLWSCCSLGRTGEQGWWWWWGGRFPRCPIWIGARRRSRGQEPPWIGATQKE